MNFESHTFSEKGCEGKKGRDGQNWYIYVRNNPLGFVDPTGLRPDRITESGVGVIDTTRPVPNRTPLQPGYPTWNAQKKGTKAEPGAQPGVTWCNQALFQMLDKLGADYSKITNKNADGTSAPQNTTANNIANNAEKNRLIKGSASMAQEWADKGGIVIAAWENQETDDTGKQKSGHVALVVADSSEYDSSKGPKILQAGSSNGEMYIKDGFGSAKMNEISYYLLPSRRGDD